MTFLIFSASRALILQMVMAHIFHNFYFYPFCLGRTFWRFTLFSFLLGRGAVCMEKKLRLENWSLLKLMYLDTFLTQSTFSVVLSHQYQNMVV